MMIDLSFHTRDDAVAPTGKHTKVLSIYLDTPGYHIRYKTFKRCSKRIEICQRLEMNNGAILSSVLLNDT